MAVLQMSPMRQQHTPAEPDELCKAPFTPNLPTLEQHAEVLRVRLSNWNACVLAWKSEMALLKP